MNAAYLVLKTANSLFGKSPALLSSEERAKAERLAARQLDLEAKVLASTEARDVAVPEATVMAAMAEVRGRYAEPEAFRQDLADNGLDETRFAEALARELRVEAILDKVASRAAQVTEVDVDLYYQFHGEEFQRPEIRRARHILITVNDDLPDNRREVARNRIDAIAARLAKDPKRFEEQALKHSECPTALQGGLLGEVTPGTLFPALEAALYALPEGGTSAVVESELGFHLLRCETIRPATAVPLADVRGKVRALLESRRRRICLNAWLKSLK